MVLSLGIEQFTGTRFFQHVAFGQGQLRVLCLLAFAIVQAFGQSADLSGTPGVASGEEVSSSDFVI
jgi:hypothetical protein